MRKFLLSLVFFLSMTFFCLESLSEKIILTSFYPMYVLTKEIAAGADGVTVQNMAEQNTGCLHDYQLSQKDAAAISAADIMVMNGGGMEQFTDRISAMRPDMPVITACEGIELKPSYEAGMMNAHVWLSPELAKTEIRNIALGLSEYDPENAAVYQGNADRMEAELEALHEEVSKMLLPVSGGQIITFHEAFNYFADEFGIVVADVIAHEPGESPSTREIAETCDLVKKDGIRALFTEPQYPTRAAEIIARETGAVIRQMDPCTSGDGTWSGYVEALRGNGEVLLEALE